MQYTIGGNQVIIYLNEKKFVTAQSLSFSVSYGSYEITGIDSMFPQEIAPGKVTVSGSISGLRLRNSGGLQGANAVSLIQDLMARPYISLRFMDRSNKEDILFIPRAIISNESHSVSPKGVYHISFNFMGMLPLFSLDRTS